MNEGTEYSSSDAPSPDGLGVSVTSEQPVATAEAPVVGTTEVPPVATAEIPAPPDQVSHPSGGKERRNLFVIIASVVAVAIVASIAAIALSGGGGKPSGRAAPKEPIPAQLQLLAPIGLAAAPDAFSVTLTWTQPAGGAEVEGYTVYKDGPRVGEVAAGTTTFTDVRVSPGKEYTYQIEAKAGGKVTDRVSVQVKTPVPALSAARLSDDFNIKLKPISQYGFQDKYTRTTAGWSFEPKCSEGACRVVWKDLSFKDFKSTLARKGARYSGSDSGKFNVKCGRTTAITTLTLKFKVTKARAVDGEWRAVRLVGTLTQREAPQLGCVSSGVNWVFTASLFS